MRLRIARSPDSGIVSHLSVFSEYVVVFAILFSCCYTLSEMLNLKVLSIAAAAVAVLVTVTSLWFYRSLHSPVHHGSSEEFILIEKGTAPGEIVSQLASKGIISNPTALRIYLRTFADPSRLKAGEYRFTSPITAMEVLKELEKGSERTVKLTIPEGWTRFEIAKRIAANFKIEQANGEDGVLALMNETGLVAEFAPNAKNLEGFLYPTTYSFPLNVTPEEVITRMVEEFQKTWQPDWTLNALKMGKTPYEIVTIASLIENESKVDSERPVIASVIYNRLDRGMALGIDATNVYIAKLLGKWDGVLNKSDFDVIHPYNTRKIAGLPPGPISSASKTAFEAALEPSKTDYLYYVLDVDKNDGSHIFYSSAAEFERGKAKYQRWLEQQRRSQ